MIQIPAMLLLFPQLPPATVLGTNKLLSISGTTVAAWRYARSGYVRWNILKLPIVAALVGSATGAQLATYLEADVMRPLVMGLLAAIWVYTWHRPSLGATPAHQPIRCTQPHWVLTAIAFTVGAYDGFFGPGTGSFMMFAMTALLGLDFLHATAQTKVLNWTTNLAALLTFTAKGQVLWEFALPFMLANVVGGWLGSLLALRGGNLFIRRVFLAVTAAIWLRLAWDLIRRL